MTRRIVVFDRVSADGYFTSGDGNLDWVVPDAELDRATSSNLSGEGTLLFGRRTYEMFASFWPHALDGAGSAANPHDAGDRSAAMRAFAVWLNAATKYVFSTTLADASWQNSHLRRALDPAEISALKRGPGGDILVFGSGTLVSQLTAHGLVDEYELVVTPLLLGSGRPLVADVPTRTRLELREARAFPSGNVMLRYARPA